MFGLLFFGYFISYSLAAIELDASTIEPLVNYTASRSFSREKSVQSCQWRRPVGASSWWCRKDTRLPSGTKVCWNEGKTSAEIKFGVVCFDHKKSKWQERSTSNVWHVATFHWQYMKAAVRLGYEFLDTSVVDAVQVRLWSLFMQNLGCTMYDVRIMSECYLLVRFHFLMVHGVSSGCCDGDGGFNSLQRRPRVKIDCKCGSQV